MQLVPLLLLAEAAGAAPGGQPRLVGGYPVTASSPHHADFPYHVQVGLYDRGARMAESLCGGALITLGQVEWTCLQRWQKTIKYLYFGVLEVSFSSLIVIFRLMLPISIVIFHCLSLFSCP